LETFPFPTIKLSASQGPRLRSSLESEQVGREESKQWGLAMLAHGQEAGRKEMYLLRIRATIVGLAS
jgi:hypothetical protein